MRQLLFSTLLIVLLTACTPAQPEVPTSPLPQPAQVTEAPARSPLAAPVASPDLYCSGPDPGRAKNWWTSTALLFASRRTTTRRDPHSHQHWLFPYIPGCRSQNAKPDFPVRCATDRFIGICALPFPKLPICGVSFFASALGERWLPSVSAACL